MLCSKNEDLEQRLQEYAHHLMISGWDKRRALRDLKKGATKSRNEILEGKRKNKGNKIAWVTTYDPRVPSKSEIIKNNLHILYSNDENRKMFPKGNIIGTDRRRKNIGEIYKPTVPRRHVVHGSREEDGFFWCEKKCDICKHAKPMKEFASQWDGRKWKIRGHLSCSTRNVIYVMMCKLHPGFMYVGTTTNLKLRWANHKSDANHKKSSKCKLSHHVTHEHHPDDKQLTFLQLFAVEPVENPKRLLERELYWQANLGTLAMGWNERKDFNYVLKNIIQF